MTDMTPQFFDDADKLARRAARPAFFARQGGRHASRRRWRRRARRGLTPAERYTPRVEFIDTGVGQGGVRRGARRRRRRACRSRSNSCSCCGREQGDRLPPHRRDAEPALRVLDSAETLGVEGRRTAPPAGCYARTPAAMATATGDGTRARRAAASQRVEELLAELGGDAHLVIAGHSLSGSLATLCAYDLPRPAAARAAGATLVTFGEPRFFTAGPRGLRHTSAGRVAALRVLVDGDTATRRAGSARRTASAGGSSSTRTPTPSAQSPTTPTPTTRLGRPRRARPAHRRRTARAAAGRLDARAAASARRRGRARRWPAELEAGRKPEQFIK